MKNYFDSFYEIIHKNSIKRRRMISLLLVLSVFVSSGVLWELRDTVVTMVNEPLCGITEHIHTDECYEYKLICGLEEDEEHTHTDECYEKTLICGYDEHIHTALCYSEDGIEGGQDVKDDKIVFMDIPDEDDDEVLLEQLDPAAAAELRLGGAMRAVYADDPTELASPGGVSTIDNIARGISITLFDYHDTENELESKLNNYDISWNSTTNQWVHNHIKYAGVNYGRNPDDDIMFFSYGTPDFKGTNADNDDENAYNIYTRTDINDISKNNYSGDYNTNGRYASQLSGNRPIQGIVKNQLSAAGYPVMNNTAAHNLDYLFSETPSAYKTVYTGVNHFLQDINGHLVYNSNNNYAYYNEDTHDFTVYESTYHIINNDHHRYDDFNNLTDTVYGSPNGGEFKIGFFPFDQYDLNRRDPNFNGNGFNHHFGMKMEARFKNLSAPTEPIVFRYSGDDDMWVFVDEVLVLDIGGIHEPAAGMIDFTNGLVWTQDNVLGKTAEEAYTELKKANAGLPEYSAIPKPNNGVNTDGAEESKWKVETISSKFAGIEGKSCDASDNKAHSIQMFYLERGGCYSNLAIDMNLPTVRPLTVTKDVDFGGHYSNDYDRTSAASSPKYQFEVLVEDPADSGNYVRADLGDGEDNPFYLRDGERKDFYLSDETKKYYVVERDIDTEVYSEVRVNNAVRPIDGGNVSSGTPAALQTTDTYNFMNIVREEKDTLYVTKQWFNANDQAITGPTGHPVKFKLYRSDNGGEPQPVEINGKMTFTVRSPDWEWHSDIMLPKRYGDHIYTYSVEELNVPEGYKASYGTDANGNPTIKNKDISNVDIHVKKNWINTLDANKSDVHLVLKRERAAYEASQPTSLQINLRDAVGNLLSTYNIASDEADESKRVYVGGSIEFAFTAPENVEYYSIDTDYPKCVPSTIDVQQIGDRTFEISDLAADNDGDPATFANVVDIKVYTDEAQDSLLLLHHSFSKWTDGWIPNGGSEILTSSYNAYAKGDGMLIRGPGDTNRTASNQGARLDLDPQIFKVNHTYTFSTYVRYDENVGVVDEQNGNKKYVIFKFTLYDGLENGDDSYHVIEQTKVYTGEWTHLLGTVTLPEDINPYGMYLIVESFDPPGQPFIGPYRFRMDEFAAAEGNHSISVDEGTGIVHVTPSERVIYDDPFGNNDYDGWSAFRNTSLSTDQYNNDYYIRVANRNNGGVSSGIKKNVPLLVPGKEYRFTASLSGDDNTSTHNYVLSIDKINLDAGNAEWSNYKNIGETGSITGYNWGTIDTLYTIPEEAVQNEMYLYFETKQGSGDTKPFRVWNVRVTEPMDALENNKAGYTLSGGTYTSNYSQYGLEPAFDSATNPLHATSDYTADTGFSREVTLNEANQWKYNWTTGSAPPDITEETGYRYRYYIEEQWIGDSTNTVSYDSTDNVWRSNDGEYIVTYSGDMVATNDEETPITVSNRSIRYRLPQTGGRGRGRIYFFGSMLTAIGIISGSALYRRRRRRV